MTMMIATKIKVVDVFSGIGGLSHGFFLEGFQVVAGIDIDETCKYGFEENNHSKFIPKDVARVTPRELKALYENSFPKVLIGCAPCTPFSTLNLNRALYSKSDEKWRSLDSFLRLVRKVRPEIVSMENVAELANGEKFPIFKRFVKTLERNGYRVSYKVVDSSKYGVPQRRKRLVLLASLLGPISLVSETHPNRPVTVRETIGDLPPIREGQTSKSDIMHRASKLSDLNKKRIIATPKDGGSATSWNRELLPKCYLKEKGQSYRSSVYGRMKWDEPSPTMTTHCHTLGTGRFGHPTQNRAISLREAARFQTFPDYYQFQDAGKLNVSTVAQHIGNAVPVRLGQIIAMSIKAHVAKFGQDKIKR
jgi:DNA (cytosine-5)-methyltransferase 1